MKLTLFFFLYNQLAPTPALACDIRYINPNGKTKRTFMSFNGVSPTGNGYSCLDKKKTDQVMADLEEHCETYARERLEKERLEKERIEKERIEEDSRTMEEDVQDDPEEERKEDKKEAEEEEVKKDKPKENVRNGCYLTEYHFLKDIMLKLNVVSEKVAAAAGRTCKPGTALTVNIGGGVAGHLDVKKIQNGLEVRTFFSFCLLFINPNIYLLF